MIGHNIRDFPVHNIAVDHIQCLGIDCSVIVVDRMPCPDIDCSIRVAVVVHTVARDFFCFVSYCDLSHVHDNYFAPLRPQYGGGNGSSKEVNADEMLEWLKVEKTSKSSEENYNVRS